MYIETPGNPLLSVIDIREVAELAHSAGALLAVDNSMMSPCLQNPIDLGATLSFIPPQSFSADTAT